jgi:hypothetical protein
MWRETIAVPTNDFAISTAALQQSRAVFAPPEAEFSSVPPAGQLGFRLNRLSKSTHKKLLTRARALLGNPEYLTQLAADFSRIFHVHTCQLWPCTRSPCPVIVAHLELTRPVSLPLAQFRRWLRHALCGPICDGND